MKTMEVVEVSMYGSARAPRFSSINKGDLAPVLKREREASRQRQRERMRREARDEEECPAGRYSTSLSNDELRDCTICSRGRWSDAVGNTNSRCEPCPKGSYNLDDGSDPTKHDQERVVNSEDDGSRRG